MYEFSPFRILKFISVLNVSHRREDSKLFRNQFNCSVSKWVKMLCFCLKLREKNI